MGVLSTIGKGLIKKTSKDSSKEVAKRGTEVMGRRPMKDMGMVDEVQPKRLSGSAAEEATKRGGVSKGAIAAGAAATGAAVGAAMSGGGKEESKSSTRSESKGRSFQEDRPTRDAGRGASDKEETGKSATKLSSFGAAFKEARAAGKDVFTYEGKKYGTQLAGEKKASSKTAEKSDDKPTGVREGRNENIDDDTRKRAMDSVANLAKGGMVKNQGIGASMKPHNMFGKKK